MLSETFTFPLRSLCVRLRVPLRLFCSLFFYLHLMKRPVATCSGKSRLFRSESRLESRRDHRRLLFMRNRLFTLACEVILMLAIAGPVVAQDNGGQQPSARQQLQQIHTPQSIDQELARLTKDLELTAQQQQQVRPLLNEHHD